MNIILVRSFIVSLFFASLCVFILGFYNEASAMIPGGWSPPAPTNSAAEILCKVASWIYGPIGKMLAALAIVAIGLTCMFGRMQVSSVLVTMAGIAVMLGAPQVVAALGINSTCPANMSLDDALNSPMLHILGCVVGWFQGPVGKSVATLSIISLGMFANFGRISYHQAMVAAIGIACIFGSFTLVANLTGLTVETGTVDTNFPLTAACPT